MLYREAASNTGATCTCKQITCLQSMISVVFIINHFSCGTTKLYVVQDMAYLYCLDTVYTPDRRQSKTLIQSTNVHQMANGN